ncbi:MAG: ABC transporter permease [Chiayiivirga sp.]|jgi:putative ABC transport system permease protein|uniref:FtsX-like permease family protein n=1 Tax=Chiayiivirga sp. TaxID=2041042 RepID=UPI0025C60FEF|nr:FtsX-like permease family protein [Chiayiivirga sp.]MCI1709596.1 ABC transporter permease [Chiayiivirga sp.]MCI1730117.1 ABC transporter permease [Chiayiivirga sp.]
MTVLQTLRQSFRAPGFAVAVILLVAGVVAVNATMFSALHALRWRALPYADGDRIVRVGADLQKLGFSIGLSERFRAQLAQQTDLVDGAFGYLGPDGAPKDEAGREWRIARPMIDWLAVLGTPVAVGRGFVADDANGDAARSVILSDRAWRQRFGADPGVLGRRLRVGDDTLTVIGVMPSGFSFPDGRADAWKPLVLSPAERADAANASVGDLDVALRLAPEATVTQVRERLDALFVNDERVADVRANAGLRAEAMHWRDLFSQSHLRTLSLLQLAGVILLVAVIANLVNLHLDRLLGRAREFRIRRALGAGDAAIVRSVAADLALPLCAGFALGMALVPFGLSLLAQRGLLPENLLMPAQFGAVSLIAGAVVTALVLGGFGLALLGSHRVGALSRVGVGSVGRARAAMLVGQVMLTTMLLGGSGLLLRSALNLMAVDPGFDAKGVLLTSVSFPASDDPSVPAATVESLRSAVAAMPGVQQVAIADIAPFSGNDQAIKIQVPGVEAMQQARSRAVGVGYFAAMGIERVRGRDFSASDLGGANPVIVDERYVERYLAGIDPLTASVDIPDDKGGFVGSPIVAVVRTVKNASLDEVVELPTVYFPQDTAYGSIFLVARTDVDPASLVEPVRQRVLVTLPGAEIGWHRPMLDLVEDTLAPRRALIELVGAFAVVTLLLAAFGLASVLGVVVRRREAEFGVRMAVGATAARIRALVLRQGGGLILIGVALGLGAGLSLSRLLAQQLFRLAPHDPLTWTLAPVLVVLVALVACWLPARRAVASPPMNALRSE